MENKILKMLKTDDLKLIQKQIIGELLERMKNDEQKEKRRNEMMLALESFKLAAQRVDMALDSLYDTEDTDFIELVEEYCPLNIGKFRDIFIDIEAWCDELDLSIDSDNFLNNN